MGRFACVFITFTFFGLGITATLVRAASDKDFDVAATARGLAPATCDLLHAGWHLLQTKAADALGLPTSWRPMPAQPVITRRDDLHVAGGEHDLAAAGNASAAAVAAGQALAPQAEQAVVVPGARSAGATSSAEHDGQTL